MVRQVAEALSAPEALLAADVESRRALLAALAARPGF
jgi:hypothetical protein